ncbi:MAG: copper oxidase [Myxococcota bacterium]|nr:copper oxidase [Myxococcota bacterium]
MTTRTTDLHPVASTCDDAADGTAGPVSRRSILSVGAALTGGALLLARPASAQTSEVPGAARPRAGAAAASGRPFAKQDWQRPGLPKRDYQPVVVPNGSKLPWKVVDGVKVFHLVAEEVEHEFAPGLKALCWGYNGSVHGPVIEAVEGDRFRCYVTNRLPAGTTVHWHGLLLPNGMDGVGGLNQKVIPPGETFQYEFTLKQVGTFQYHSHHDEMTQMALGMTGLFVIHPRRPVGPRIDRDFAFMLHEWKLDAGARRPDPNEMIEFNLLTMNAKAFPGTEPMVVRKGQRVRIRIGNLSAMDHHPIHLHGYQFMITETDGGRIADSAQWPETTVVVPVGSTRTIEFVADEPGDWAFHCHMTHHVMNQMGHGFPNMIGVDAAGLDAKVRTLLPGYMTMGQTGMDMSEHLGHMKMPPNSIPMVGAKGKHDYITMGGMFTVLKVRDALRSYTDPGWYENPPGTLASNAAAEALRRDGINVEAPPRGDAGEDVRFG